MKHLSAVIILFLAFSSIVRASDGIAKDSIKLANPRAAEGDIIWAGLGAGVGMDYGGFGLNYTAFPAKNIGIFGGLGYAYANVGYNLGLKLRFLPGAKLNPFALGMYGSNAAFTVTGESSLSRVFEGFTTGIGTDYKAKPESKGYWSIALLLPFQTSETDDYKDFLNENFDGEYHNWIKSVGFSFGYHRIIGGRK